MSTTIKSVFQPINDKAISDFELIIKALLPKEYKSFIIQTNGGFPKPDIFIINDFQGTSIIDIFYGFSDGISYPHLDLIKNYIDTRLDIPKNVIPIGEDPGGNYICMSLSEDNYGKIYFWDHEVPNEDENGKPTYDNMYLIAEGFNVFIDNLH